MDPRVRSYVAESIMAIGQGDVPTARTCIAEACDIDPSLFRLADAVHLACAELESVGGVSISAWNTLADAVDSGELREVVESSRTW
ncbi:MAG: hypothetical protein ACFCU2_08050 [Acidimicrobiia bacterium]